MFGDPVLKTTAAEVADIDAKLVRLADEMLEAMYAAPGPRPRRTAGRRAEAARSCTTSATGPRTIVNPTIKESRGEWVYDEGCLSIPHLYVEMVRPKEVLMAGWDLDGNEVEVEADELTARLFQHELDHLAGHLDVRPHEPGAAAGGHAGVPPAAGGPPERRPRSVACA